MADERMRITRREVLRGAGAAALAGSIAGRAEAQQEPLGEGISRAGPGPVKIAFGLNGKRTALEVEPRVTLLDALRDRIGLTGTKRICDHGACGGCTVWVDGRTVNACMMLAIDADGAEVTTVEGLARGDSLHPVQQAFVEHDAMQCGFCTSGMVMSGAALLAGNPKPSDAEIREAVAGNLCRCGTYPHVFRALKEASR